ncbi:hypothetical protein DMENIID0001_022000 [Sergentomyia squamirostris]
MDFDLDDPLDDILKSDESDSFFDTKGKKDAAEVKSSVGGKKDPPGRAKMSDLFGLSQSENTPKPLVEKPKTPILPESAKPKIEPPIVTKKEAPPKKVPELKTKVSFDDDDLMSDLGFDPKQPKAKTNIFDDILAPSLPAPVKRPDPRPKTTPTPISKPSTVDPTDGDTSVPGPSGRPRTAGRPTTAIPDPLGLFTDSKEKEMSKQEASVATKIAPKDWLGLGTDSSVEKPKPQPPEEIVTQSKPSLDSSKLSLANKALESETVLQTMRQQETQLHVASQLKNQERALVEIQSRQAELLQRQEIQFAELMQKQTQRQSALEDNIRRQQEKINSHIEILMNQPVFGSLSMTKEDPVSEDRKNNETIEVVELKADVRRLELEKLRLEDLISNVKNNHEEELILMERSHKKQISVLEETLSSLEERLKRENSGLEDFYTKKLEKLQEEKLFLLKEAEEKLVQLKADHKETLATLRQTYESDVENLKTDHQRMVENIRQSKIMEFAVVQENSSYIQQLKTASTYLESASGNIESLRETIDERITKISDEKMREFEVKERKLEDELKRVERSRDLAESERLRLLEMVNILDVKLTKLSKEASEEQWMLKQKLSTLEVERTSFEREREFVREEQKRHEKRIEDMKMLTLQEHQRMMSVVEDERRKIVEERLKLEMMEKVNPGRTSQVEVDIALKIAEDAAREVDKERDNLMKLQREVESMRRQLLDRENTVKRREVDLEAAIRTAQARETAAESALESAKGTETQLFQKYQQLSQNSKDLCVREEKLSQSWEKLSKERLELQSLRRDLTESKCSLCRFGQTNQKIANLLSKASGGDHTLTEEVEKLSSITDDELLIASKRKNQRNNL